MPIYEYQCKHCGDRFEALQKHGDQSLITCPKCGENALEKCVSLTSFQLKGKGWYETDYKPGKTADKEDKKPKPAKETKKTTDKKTGDKS